VPRKQPTPAQLWQDVTALAGLYRSEDTDDSAPWSFTIEPWTLTATSESPAVSVLWNDWPTGEIAPDHAEIFAPGFPDAARELHRDLHQHIRQYHRLRRIPTQDLLIPYP